MFGLTLSVGCGGTMAVVKGIGLEPESRGDLTMLETVSSVRPLNSMAGKNPLCRSCRMHHFENFIPASDILQAQSELSAYFD